MKKKWLLLAMILGGNFGIIQGSWGPLGTPVLTYGTNGVVTLSEIARGQLSTSISIAADTSVFVGVLTPPDSSTDTTFAIIKLDSSGAPVTTFGTNGILSLALDGMVSFDQSGNLLVSGPAFPVTPNSSWVTRINPTDGAIMTNFAQSNIINSAITLTQSSGRILVAGGQYNSQNEGIEDGPGMIVAYTPQGTIDTTFGVNGVFTDPALPSDITSFAIDNADNIWVTCLTVVGDQSYASLVCILPNGTGLNQNFNMNGYVTGVFGPVPGWNTPFVAVNSVGNITLVATNNNGQGIVDSGEYIVLQTYDPTGIIVYTSTPLFLSSVTLLGIVVNTNDQITVFGGLAQGPFSSQWNADLTINADYGTAGTAMYSADLIAGFLAASIMSSGQSDGMMYVVGSGVTGPTVDPIVLAIYGEQNVGACPQQPAAASVGTPDVSVQSNSNAQNRVDFAASSCFGSVLDGYEAIKILSQDDGTLYVVFCNGVDVRIGKIGADYQPLLSFGPDGTGLTPPVFMDAVHDFMLTTVGDFVVAGEYAGAGVVRGLQSDGDTPIELAVPGGFAACTALAQTKVGRVMAVLQPVDSQAAGTAYAFQRRAEGAAVNYVVDVTYGAFDKSGYYALQDEYGIPIGQSIDDLFVDGKDCAYIVYHDSTVKLQKIGQQGYKFDPAFNGGLSVDTGIVATGQAALAINNAGNMIVVAPGVDGISWALIDGASGEPMKGGSSEITADGVADATAAGGKFYAIVNDSVHQASWTLCIDETGILATDFANGTGTAATDQNNAHQMNGIAVKGDGKILGAAQVFQDSQQLPVIYVEYGYAYVPESKQSPDAAPAGTVDYTLSADSTGAVDLIAKLSWANLDGYSVQKICNNATNGTVVYAFDNGTDIKLVEAYSDYSPNNDFNGQGYLAIPGQGTFSSMLVVASGKNKGDIHFHSHNSKKHYYNIINPQGLIIDFHPSVDSFILRDAIQQQSGGGMLVAGKLGEFAAVVRYDLEGNLDGGFGNDGMAVFDGTALPALSYAIADITVDSLDRQYVAGVDDAGKSFVYHLDATGSFVDIRWTAIEPLTGITNGELHIVQDAAANLVLAGATAAGLKIIRYSPADGSTLNKAFIPVDAVVHLVKLYSTSDGKLVAVGWTEAGEMIAARVLHDLTLDPAWVPDGLQPGVFQGLVGSLVELVDATISPDTRNYAVGNDADGTPLQFALYNDGYVEAVKQSPDAGQAGSLDLTLAGGGTGFALLNSLDQRLDGTRPEALALAPDGSMFVVMRALELLDHVTSESFLVSLNKDCTLGSAGMVLLPASEPKIVMMLDAKGNPLVAGSDGHNFWMQDYDKVTGEKIGAWPAVEGMASVVGILTQFQGRVVVCGHTQDGTSFFAGLAPCSYDNGVQIPVASFDPSFGNLGRFWLRDMSGIDNFVIDPYDRLLGVLKAEGGSVSFARALPNASGLDTTLNRNGIVVTDVIAAPGQPAFIAYDTQKRIVVVTEIAEGISARRYDYYGRTEDLNFNMTSSDLGLNNPIVTQIVVDMNDNILIEGYENAPEGRAFTLRIDGATRGLDPLFNAAGQVAGVLAYSVADGATNIVSVGAVGSDGKIKSLVYSPDFI